MSTVNQSLDEMQLLKGKKYRITLSELRQQPGDVFTKVQMGAEFDVTKKGKVIATIAAPEPTAQELGAAARKMKSAY